MSFNSVLFDGARSAEPPIKLGIAVAMALRIFPLESLVAISLSFVKSGKLIAEKSGLSKVDSKKALEAFIESVTEEVKKDGKVALVGFGTFSVTQKAARKGINPRTKAVINFPSKKTVKFKAGADLAAL